MTDFEGLGSAEVVIGEGVALEVPVAGVGTRIVGALIDIVVQVVLLIMALFVLVNYLNGVDNAIASGIVIVTIFTVLVGVPFLVETLTGGRSLGKLAMGTRVVRADHGPITARHAFVRALIGTFETWATGGSFAAVTAMLTKNSTRLGDLAAGTIVVKERVPLVTPAPAPMPPRLVHWASHADLAAMPPDLAMGIRQFLLRRSNFSPAVRVRLADELLARASQYASPAPPSFAEREEILFALLAERGRRDRERLARDESLRRRLLRMR